MTSTRQRLLYAAMILVIAGVWTWIYFSFRKPPIPPEDLTPSITVGEVAATEVAKLVDNTGKIVVLVAEFASPTAPSSAAQLDGLKTTLRQHPGLELLAVEPIRFDPPLSFLRGIPFADYLALLDKYPTADAFVSLAGAPVLLPAEVSQLPAQRPKLVCLAMNPKILPSLFEAGVVQTAIMPRLKFPAPTPSKPPTNRDQFDQQYMVVTAANAAAILAEIFPKR